MIKLAPTKNDFNRFMAVTAPVVASYVIYSKSSLAYDYYGGPKQRMLEKAFLKASQYFSDWDTNIAGSHFNSNDVTRAREEGEGGGVTGPVCHFGTMPCFFSIRFWKTQLLFEIYRAVQDVGPGVHSWRPGDRLYRVQVYVGPDVFAHEECFFGNILSR
jgi:hypothetical protein